MNYFRTNADNKIIVRGGYFIDCCCETVSTGTYWEGIPCGAMLNPTETCNTGDYANLFKNRIFVKDDSFCEGTQYEICETQRFRLFLLENCTGTDPIKAFTVEWDDPATTGFLQYNLVGGVPTVTIGTTGAVGPYTVRSFAATGTVNDTLGRITNLSADFYDNHFTVNTVASFINTFPFRCIEPEQEFLNLIPGNSGVVLTKTPGVYLKYSGITDAYVMVNDLDPDAIVSRLASVMDSTFGLAARDVIYNTGYTAPFYTHFDLKLGCGRPFQKIEVDYVLHDRFNPFPDVFQYGDDPAYSYYNPVAAGKNYFEWGTNTNCRWENSDIFGVFPTAYDGFVDCVPQVGGKIVYPQYNNPFISGYDRFANSFANRFGNLNSVIKYNDKCYSLSPSFFLMGMEGRLYKNYYYDKLKHTAPNTANVSIPSGIMPNNCSYELFLPLFHADVPWGPFGSYCNGLENKTHLAWTYPYNTVENPETSGVASVLSVDYPVPRVGYSYRPFGFMKTRGTWLKTEIIEMYVAIKAPVPYYVGSITGYDDIDQLLQIDPASCINGISVSGPTACAPVNISFETSGKTIGQFIDAVNALRAYNYTGVQIFNFAIASEYVRDFPASTVVNVSSEIMDRNTLGYTETPDGDESYQSASNIIMPKAYPYYHGGSELNGAWSPTFVPTQYYGSVFDKNVVAYVPPACTLLADRLPKDPSSLPGNVQNQNNMWWTSMPITVKDIVSISLDDPAFTTASVKVATGRMQLSVSGSFVASTGIALNRGGLEYTDEDLVNEINAITFTGAMTTHTPFVANTILPYDYWIDDDTSETAGVYSYGTSNPTEYNYSYKEQLLDFSGSFVTSVTLPGLHRRRCNWYGVGYDYDQDPYLDYCIPPEASRIATENLDCDGDRQVVLGYVLSQGCSSNNCITKWYIPAQRCSCDTVSRCNNGESEELPHPYNQPRNGLNAETWSKAGWDGYTVSQPTLYICEYNFFKSCDVPLLIKVPFLVQDPNGTFFLQAGSDPTLPGSNDFCNSTTSTLVIRSNLYGWCQYIDWSEVKVREEEIPRSNTPEALVIGRTCGALCTTKPWNYDPELTKVGFAEVTLADGPMYFTIPGGSIQASDPRYATANECPSFSCFSCDSWDRMCGVGIVFRDYTAFTNGCALFRASVGDVTVDDVAGNGSLTRIDVDCSTTCCESWFACDPATNDGYYTKHVRHPWTQSVSYSYAYSTDEQLGCDFTVAGGPSCTNSVFAGLCIGSLPGICYDPPLYTNGKRTRSMTWALDSERTSCGCNPQDLQCVTETVTDSPDCGYSYILCDGPSCISLVDPVKPDGTTACGNCDNYPFPLPICENRSESSTFSEDYNGVCGIFGQHPFVTDGSNDLDVTCTSTFEDCDGAGNYNYSLTSSTILNWYGANISAIQNGSITLNNSTTVSYTVGSRVWTAPSPSLPATVKTIPELRDYWDDKSPVFGYPNYNIVSSTGPFDTRVKDPVCTGT